MMVDFASHTLHTDGSAVVSLSGELDMASACQLWQVLVPLLRLRRVTVDMSDVSFLDCAGLRPLLRAANAVEASGGKMSLRGLGTEPLLVLTRTGSLDVFDVEVVEVFA